MDIKEVRAKLDKAVIDARKEVALCDTEYTTDREYVIQCHKNLVAALDAVMEFRDEMAYEIRDYIRLSKETMDFMQVELDRARKQRHEMIVKVLNAHDTKGATEDM
jgi:hypothetical protein